MTLYPASSHVRKTFEQLLKLLPAAEKTKPQVLLLAGESTGCRHDTDRELAFRQESNFYYLTGCNVPSAFVLAAFQPGTSLEQTPSIYLFIPEANEDDIMWSVPPPSLTIAAESHDVTRVDHPPALQEIIATLLPELPGALVHTLPHNSPLYPELPQAYTSLALAQDSVAVTDYYLLTALQNARLTKDTYEIDLIRRANTISSRAHEVVMRVLGSPPALSPMVPQPQPLLLHNIVIALQFLLGLVYNSLVFPQQFREVQRVPLELRSHPNRGATLVDTAGGVEAEVSLVEVGIVVGIRVIGVGKEKLVEEEYEGVSAGRSRSSVGTTAGSPSNETVECFEGLSVRSRVRVDGGAGRGMLERIEGGRVG
ncbi:hypothetical protein C0992_005350 [Termitomyces sp. T32_za158]|nr:hypothetical protein C0992_005350 [Termitomyces sp. T32_za158]